MVFKQVKNKLLKKRKKNAEDSTIKEALTRISKVIRKSSKESMNAYYENNILSIGGDLKKCWRFLNDITGRSQKKSLNVIDSNGLYVENNILKSSLFNEYFINVSEVLRSEIVKYPDDNCNFLRSLRHHKPFYFESSFL